jgi:hypothetical protein
VFRQADLFNNVQIFGGESRDEALHELFLGISPADSLVAMARDGRNNVRICMGPAVQFQLRATRSRSSTGGC